MSAGNFKRSVAHVLTLEGEYVDHPDDPGGATNMGITRRTLALWRGVTPYTALSKTEVRNLGRAEAMLIYKVRYWDACACDLLPAGLDLALFDFGVHSGPDRAVKMLQAEIGVQQDGRIGRATLAAIERTINQFGLPGLIDGVIARRLGFLRGLSSFAVFGRGWQSRIASVRRLSIAMTKETTPSIPTQENTSMNLLNGYKTYIICAAMILAAIAQLTGVDLPALDGQTAGQLLMEAFAIIFLRRGIESAKG